MWDSEQLTTSTTNNKFFGYCCMNGQVALPELSTVPKEMLDLLTINTKQNIEFKTHIRLYNSLLAFTSSSANVDESLMRANTGVYTYRINGAVHHKLSNYLHNPEYKPHFSQIYIYDADMQSNIRANMFPHVIKASILNTIQDLLEMNNPYVRIYMQAGKLVNSSPDTQYNIVLKADVRTDRTKNKPTSNEIAVLMVEDDQTTVNKRDVIVRPRNSSNEQPFKFINENISMYDPLAYPILHLAGEPGWQYNLYPKRSKKEIENMQIITNQSDDNDDYINHNQNIDNQLNEDSPAADGNRSKYVTARQFYSYRLQDRLSIKKIKYI
jgi:hypothetical protein